MTTSCGGRSRVPGHLRNAAELLLEHDDPTAVAIWAAAHADPQAAALAPIATASAGSHPL